MLIEVESLLVFAGCGIAAIVVHEVVYALVGVVRRRARVVGNDSE